ncbi:MAG: ABC transporter substrate-binding protein [Lachnospiraceae bacterium]
MKKRIRMTAGLLALAMALTACGGQKTKENEVQQESLFNKEYVFREEEFELTDNVDNLMQITVVGDTIYTEEANYSMSGGAARLEEADTGEETGAAENVEEGYILVFTAYDLKGNQLRRFENKLPANCGPGSMTADSQGNIYSVYSHYGTGDDGNEDYRVYLQGHSPEGQELFTLWLNENQSPDEYYYVNSLICTEDGRLILESGSTIEIYDSQGTELGRIDNKEGGQLLKIRGDVFITLEGDGENAFLQTIDLESGQRGEKQELPFPIYSYNYMSGSFYDFYLSNEKGIFGFNLGDAEPTMIMDFLSSDFASYGMSNVSFLDEDNFIALYYGEEGSKLSRFVKIPAEEVVEKKEIILGCYYLDSAVKTQAMKFNKESNTHRIVFMDYSEYNTEEDYTIGLNRLNSDIASGKVPDIVALQNGMPVESYMAKGLFTDYYELMEKDSTFKKEDYLQNVFEAYSMNGKLYQMVPSFYVRTIVGRTEDVGEDFSWTMDEALALQASKPEGTVLFTDMIQTDFLGQCLLNSGNEYINWETGECRFDSEEFIQMLEYAKTLPEKYNEEDYFDESVWQERETQYREGKAVLFPTVLSSFNDYGNWKYATFGDDITMVGFPTKEGNGSALISSFNLAISAQSEAQDVAWQFVKSFLEEEYQDNMEYFFPIRLSSLQKQAQKAMEKPYYTDNEGNKVEYDMTYYVGSMEIKVDPLNKEETDRVMEFLQSINKISSYNDELFNIVSEESQSFLQGEKSAKEAAEIIQSRAKIYINENR